MSPEESVDIDVHKPYTAIRYKGSKAPVAYYVCENKGGERMTRVETISPVSASLQNLASARGNAPAATDNSKQFEHFLKNENTAKREAVEQAVKRPNTQDTAYTENSQVRKEELQKVQTTTPDTRSEEEILSDEELAALKGVQDGIRDILHEELHLEDEVIDAALQNMGITLFDLLNPEMLQQFVLTVSGGQESTDFLTNETLMQNFTNVLQALEGLQEENSEILSLLEKLEQPVVLEEFLRQQGIESSVMTEALPEEPSVGSGVAGQSVQGENAEAVSQSTVADMEKVQTAVVKETGSDKTTVEEAQMKVSQGENADKTTVETVAVNSSDDAGEEENMSGKQSGQNMNDILFTKREEFVSEDRTVTTPLFAERLESFAENGIRFLRTETGATQRMQQMVDIVNQVSEKLRSSVNANTTSVEMQLNPESLGKVFLSVVSKNGVMTASFQVQTEEAKNALESQILILRENLEAKDLKVESVEVMVSDFSFTQSNQADGQNPNDYERQSRKRFRYDAGEEETEAVEEVSAEEMRRQVMRDTGGSIDYTA